MKRIVIADDSGTARMFLRRCMEITGLGEAAIIEAENGKEALTLVKNDQTDLLITDLNMPVMDGLTLLKWVKASPKLSDLKVLIVSSAGNPAKEAELKALGAYGVIGKPVSPTSIRENISFLLEEEAYGRH